MAAYSRWLNGGCRRWNNVPQSLRYEQNALMLPWLRCRTRCIASPSNRSCSSKVINRKVEKFKRLDKPELRMKVLNIDHRERMVVETKRPLPWLELSTSRYWIQRSHFYNMLPGRLDSVERVPHAESVGNQPCRYSMVAFSRQLCRGPTIG
jgi:hypothetical protein